MAKVIFIGSDRNIFKEGSSARARIIEYGSLFEELHIVVFTKRNIQLTTNNLQLGENIWVYPTRSWNRWFYPFNGARIAKMIIKEGGEGPWIVSAQDPFEAGLAAKWASKKTGAKLHIQVHTDFLSPFFKLQSMLNILRLRIAGKILPHADGIRVVSPRIFHSLTKHFTLDAKRLSVLPIFSEKKDLSNILPYDYKKDNPNWIFTIISVGRLEPEKNFELAIRTVKIVSQKYPNIGLVIIGDGSLKKYLKSLVDSLGLSKNVLFIDSWQKNLSPFYLGAEIYLQTSNYEGFGLASVEAAYAGLPVITTDVGVAGWIFKNGENSKICPVGDDKCLSFEIIKVIENNQLREQIIGKLKNSFGGELIQSKTEYLKRYKESIENCLG